MTQVLRRAEELDRSERVRQAARLIIEETLEAEVSEALGRGYYDRRGMNHNGSAMGIVRANWRVRRGGLSIRFPRRGVCQAGDRKSKRRWVAKQRNWNAWP